jgi:transketolase
MEGVEQLEKIASQVRRDIIRMVHGANSGHPGGSLGCVEYMVALYFNIMEHKPDNFTMDGKDQDMFFLSNGHISPLWYSVLARSGYFDIKELSTFRKINSRLQGHPATAEGLPGIRIASGSLGQGLSVAAGAAIAKKINNDPHLIFTLHGDGEIEEGQIWEAAMFAAARKLDNIISTIDYNDKQIDGPVHKVLNQGDLEAKWKAFGWDVFTVENGNNMSDVLEGFNEAKKRTGKGKPVMMLLKTEMGYGVDFMMGTHAWHGKAPNDEQTKKALEQLTETLGDY